MLEIRHATGTQRPKKGVPVKALDDVSVSFPDRGMVFILGKSGSGKSTLLNVLGGLYRATSSYSYSCAIVSVSSAGDFLGGEPPRASA